MSTVSERVHNSQTKDTYIFLIVIIMVLAHVSYRDIDSVGVDFILKMRLLVIGFTSKLQKKKRIHTSYYHIRLWYLVTVVNSSWLKSTF